MLDYLKEIIERKRDSKKIWDIIFVSVKDYFWFVSEIKPVKIVTLHLSSWLGGLKYQKDFRNIKTFCLFVGYSRSGHSLVGNLLDAHPNIIISQELDVLRFINLKFSRNQIFYLILRNSQIFTKKGRKWGDYPYAVNGQWQGKFKKILVIGDKKGDYSAKRIRRQPKLLEMLAQKTNGLRLKFIHVVRNPFDNISTIARASNLTLTQAIDYYFALAETAAKIRQKYSQQVIDVKHEELIKNPQLNLKKICQFLGVETPADYLNDGAGLIWQKPHQTRAETNWTPALIAEVAEKIKQFDFLKNYTYDN